MPLKRRKGGSFRARKKMRTSYGRKQQGLVPTYRGFAPMSFGAGEWKYLDTTTAVAVNTTGSITLLNGMARGTTALTRIGQKINIKSIEIRTVNFATLSTGINQVHRMFIVQDKQCNGAAPTISQILASTGTFAPRNLENRKRFRIMWDKFFVVGPTANENANVVQVGYKKFRGRGLTVDYNTGNAGTVADISTNSLHFVVFGNIAAGTTAGECSFYIRIRYTDN